MRYLVVILACLCYGCNSSVLQVDPSDRYSASTFWRSEENFKAGLAGVYNALTAENRVLLSELDMLTPNAFDYGVWDINSIATGRANSNTEDFQRWWSWGYRGVGRANTLLAALESQGGILDEDDQRAFKGEALFLRSFFYSVLVDLYGDVPLIVDAPDMAAQGKLTRTAKDEIAAFILNDLDEAATLLPEKEIQRGRVTKGAALALKSRVLLYGSRWEEAAAAAKHVIDLNQYQLFPDYRGLYLPQNEGNVEVIFDVQFLRPHVMHSGDHYIYTWGRPAPLKNLVDDYLMRDGKPREESSLYDLDRPYENRDPRLLQSIVVSGYPFNGMMQQAGTNPVQHTGFGQKKLTSYPDDVEVFIPLGESDLNIIVIRYAEVLLNYAEALNELHESPNAEIYWAMNLIRKRPSVDMPDIEMGMSKLEMRETIRHERRIELALENLYYSDIRRWRIAEIVNNGPIYNANGDVIENRQFNPDRDYLWPVPQREIDLNPNLTQNPNW